MAWLQQVVLGLVVLFVAFSLWLQFMARWRSKALEGQPVPALPGATGQRITAAPQALVYFYTPTCAACRTFTPRIKALAARGANVFPVDATVEPELARALSVMATPTTVELSAGRITQVHVGPIPQATFARFQSA